MEKCVHCGADTDLLVAGRPVCTRCDDEHNAEMKANLDAILAPIEKGREKYSQVPMHHIYSIVR